MSVGTNIRKRRFELRMSQQELADALGYKTRSTIAKIESGENDVSQKKLLKFAEALDTTVEALITGISVHHLHRHLLPRWLRFLRQKIQRTIEIKQLRLSWQGENQAEISKISRISSLTSSANL